MGNDKKELSMDMLDQVTGGVLEEGWQQTVDQFVFFFAKTNDPQKVQELYNTKGLTPSHKSLIEQAVASAPPEDVAVVMQYIKEKYGVSL